MLLGIIALILFALVVYYHTLQGLFTSLISAFCAFIGVLLAFGYFEPLSALIGGDFAPALSLVGVFAITYLVLRILIDALVPGNLHVHLYADKAGSVIFGAIAGAIGVGTLIIAAQLMPFGPSIAGYARHPVTDRPGLALTPAEYGDDVRQGQDVVVSAETVEPKLEPEAAQNLLVPVDSFVVSLVTASSGGAFTGSAPFGQVHPHFLTDAFGLRIGAEQGGRRVLVNTTDSPTMSAAQVFLPNKLTGKDAEVTALRPGEKPLTLETAGGTFVVVRVTFENSAADANGIVRMTPGSVRLVVNGESFNPVGTMGPGGVVAIRRVDDLLIVPLRGQVNAADFVFDVPPSVASALGTPQAASAAVPPFIEVLLLGRTSLAGVPVVQGYTPSPNVLVLQKAASPAGPARMPGEGQPAANP